MRIISALLLGLLVASCAAQGPRDRGPRPFVKADANPSAVVAAELRFARLAQEKGQWTAFRETAAEDAVMFVPNLRNAQEWLKDKADPTQAVDWQPHKVVMSCDGTLAVSIGAWQDAKGGAGKFWTIWQKQKDASDRERQRGEDWKWVFDHGVPLDKPLEEPDFVETEVADCNKPLPLMTPPPLSPGQQPKGKSGRSTDNSMLWVARENYEGSRLLSVGLAKGNGVVYVIKEDFGKPSK